MACCQSPRGEWSVAPVLAVVALLTLLFAGMQQTTAFPSWRLEVCRDHFMTATFTVSTPSSCQIFNELGYATFKVPTFILLQSHTTTNQTLFRIITI